MNLFALATICISLMLFACSKTSPKMDNVAKSESPMDDMEADMEERMYVEDPTVVETGNRFDDFAENPFVEAEKQPVSTFSVDADGASYAIMRRMVNENFDLMEMSVRIEELLNYFTFDYPTPTDNNTVAVNAEVGSCPWNADHKLLRLGIKGKELKANEVPQANFVFLVDVSGSMSSEDKIYLLKS